MNKNVNNIYVRSVTTASGDVNYYLYNDKDCIGQPIENGLLEQISENNYEKFIETDEEINDIFSIKVVDGNGCETCMNKNLPQVTPVYVTVTPQPTITLTATLVTSTPTITQSQPQGQCYILTIPDTALNDGSNDLYIVRTNASTGQLESSLYTTFSSLSGNNEITIPLCSTTFPVFRYGEFGQIQVVNEINIQIGQSCQFDNECNIL